MAHSVELIAFGDIYWIECAGSNPLLGGSAYVAARCFKTLGASAALVSRVGNDALGARAMTAVEREGFDTRWIQVDSLVATPAVAGVNETAVPFAPFDQIVADEPLLALARKAKLLYLSSMAARELVSKYSAQGLLESGESLRCFLNILLEPGSFAADTLGALLEEADAVTMRDRDLGQLCAILGVPNMESELVAQLIVERYRPEWAVISDNSGAVVAASRKGEEIQITGRGAPRARPLEWQAMFSASVAVNFFETNALHASCEAARDFADQAPRSA